METELLLGGIIGLLTGIIASITVWFVTTKIIVPRIDFSEHISKTKPLYLDRPKYRFRMRNKGKRNIVDNDIYFRMRIKGLYKDDPHMWEVVVLPIRTSIGNSKVPVLKPTSQNYYGTTYEIYAHKCQLFNLEFYPKEIKDKCINEKLTLEDIFNLGTETEGNILFFGYDEFSGARKYFISKTYKISDIREGYYKDRTMIIEKSNKQI
jgi:hypothetical protein